MIEKFTDKIVDKILTYEAADSPAITQEDVDSINESTNYKEAARLLSGAVFLRNTEEQVDIQKEKEMIEAYRERLIEIMFPKSFLNTLPVGITYKPHIHVQLRKTAATITCSYEKGGEVQDVWIEAKGYRKPDKDGWLEYTDTNFDNSYSAEDVIPIPAGATVLEVRDMMRDMVYALFMEQELYPKNY